MNIKLLPCPFCGEKQNTDSIPSLVVRSTDMFWPRSEKDDDFQVWAHCLACEADGPKIVHSDNLDWGEDRMKIEACHKWNKRP